MKNANRRSKTSKKPAGRKTAPSAASKASTNGKPARAKSAVHKVKEAPDAILVVDIGGSKVKFLVKGEASPRRFVSGPALSPLQMVNAVKDATKDWKYEAGSVGYPGLVGDHGPRSEPGNLAPGWVGFDFAAAFERPVRILNDAALQALGSYEGGRMLFLGLGTGLGSTLISQNAIIPLELGCLPHPQGKTFGEILGRRGMERSGKRRWRKAVVRAVHSFLTAFEADYVVLGGGNAKLIKVAPTGARLAHNQTAFRGGFRLWHSEGVCTHSPDGEGQNTEPSVAIEWRVL